MGVAENVINLKDMAKAIDVVLSTMLDHAHEIGLSVEERYKLEDYRCILHHASECNGD